MNKILISILAGISLISATTSTFAMELPEDEKSPTPALSSAKLDLTKKDTVIIGGLRSHDKMSEEYGWTIHSESNFLLINNADVADCDYKCDGFSPNIDINLPEVFKTLSGKIKSVCFEHVRAPRKSDAVNLFKWASLLETGGQLTCISEWNPLTYNGDTIEGPEARYIMIDDAPRFVFSPKTKVNFPYVPLFHEFKIDDPLLKKIRAGELEPYGINIEEDRQYIKGDSPIWELLDLFKELNLTNIKMFFEKRRTSRPDGLYCFKIFGTKQAL